MQKKIWFKRKLYGWGWYPSSWQGFVVTIVLVVFIVYLAKEFLVKGKIIEYFIGIIIAILILIYIAYKKGEKPRWSWGK